VDPIMDFRGAHAFNGFIKRRFNKRNASLLSAMSLLILCCSEQATSDIIRLAEFLEEIEPSLKQKVISTIFEAIEVLERFFRIANILKMRNIRVWRAL